MDTFKLIMVVGLPGTGKSTFSRALADEIDAKHLNSDVIRTELGLRGKYAPADKAKVYQELKERTKALLTIGATVIVDATLYREDLRQFYSQIARQIGCPVLWIELRTGEETIKQRVSKQRPYSEADMAVYQKIKSLYEPITDDHFSLETDVLSLETLVHLANNFIDHEPTTN
jgi:predicted kinase